MKKQYFKNVLNFILKTSFKQLISGIGILLVGVLIWVLCFPKTTFVEQWGIWLEAYSTFSLIFISLVIWFNEKHENWISSLPKKLDIDYIFEGKVYCTVKNAPLTHEGDIRQWGQSIAKTILNNQKVNINFSGYSTSGPQKEDFYLSKTDQKTMKIMKYYLKVYIREKIELVDQDDVFEFDFEGDLIPLQEKQIASEIQ